MKIYGSPALQKFLDARERGAGVSELTKLAAAAQAESAQGADRRAATAKLLAELGLDEHLAARPDLT
jgi:hypothetical protein